MTDISQRKKAHVELTASDKAAYEKTTGLEHISFQHNALPELNLSEISTKANFAGREFSMPLFISSMTGGYTGAKAVNQIIAETCERWNLPFGVGSQRAMLLDFSQADSFSVVRKMAPKAFIASNIGGCQLIQETKLSSIHKIIDVIEANALIVHLNPLQELMQPEGDSDFKGILNQIEKLVSSVQIPVIVKETGAGIHANVARKLVDVGVSIIDVAAAGGTSWAKVENLRKSENLQENEFNEWGIPLVDCLLSYKGRNKNEYSLMASGGIKSAFDMIKCLGLGADFTAIAQPVIKAIVENGEEGFEKLLKNWQENQKRIQLLLGVKTVSELSKQHFTSSVYSV